MKRAAGWMRLTCGPRAAPASGPIRVAYLQQFPLWKTSYRVDLGQTDGKIQGWAQIDNPTGESWDNVTVSLFDWSASPKELDTLENKSFVDPDPMLSPGRHNDQLWRKSIDTCHVWASDGEAVAAREAGVAEGAPVFLRTRLAKLGVAIPDGTRTDDH
jgi:hypothetical protein